MTLVSDHGHCGTAHISRTNAADFRNRTDCRMLRSGGRGGSSHRIKTTVKGRN
ncbi:hypothetical protein RISK_003359 [Rhodopirellula islandica]|uniref:Uncharacterized protein n=1 Tax=Rhodopirellula islandica TaxID=595434 RepID=A0A0J1BDR4_RHOIS|nr:hypothetical protein RISK_003359 [Rhodopirellula islandica]